MEVVQVGGTGINQIRSNERRLILACSRKEIVFDYIKDLVEMCGVNPDRIRLGDGGTLLHSLIEQKDSKNVIKVFKYFVENGVDIDAHNLNGETVTMLAAEKSRLALLKVIAKFGADLDKQNDALETAIFYAIASKNERVLTFFLEQNVSLNVKDKVGETPQEFSVTEGWEKGAKIISKFTSQSSGGLKIYDSDKFEKNLEAYDGTGKNEFIKKLKAKGDYRTPSKGSKSTLLAIEQLLHKFPNFKNVLDFVKCQLALSLMTEDQGIKIPPILIHGDAGIGKSRFIKELSRALNVDLQKVDCPSVTAGWVLSGSSPTWKGASAGKVAKYFVSGDYSNPLFWLDEIDKMNGNSEQDPYGPLYSLLESDTSCDFQDEFCEIKFDCSQILWLSTANDINAIPETIFSRFTPFKVKQPSKDQMPAIVRSIYQDILKEHSAWGKWFSDELSEECISALANLSPRKIKGALLESFGNFAVSKVDSNDSLDNQCCLEPEHFESNIVRNLTKVGFC